MCQEGGRRSKKILQGYLNTMIELDRCKMMIHKMKKRWSLKKYQKPKFVDTDSDDSDDEQEPTAKQPKKTSKSSKFVDTGIDNEQG